MKLFNLSNGIYNKKRFNKIINDTDIKLCWRLAEIETIIGYKINKEVIQVLGTKRLLDCYTNQEIINILQHYELLKEEI